VVKKSTSVKVDSATAPKNLGAQNDAAPIDAARAEMIWLAPNAITPYKNNPRQNAGAVGEVRKSIGKYGWLQPASVDALDAVDDDGEVNYAVG
jgi:ParB-like chromosome segregation protein Spo0J